MPRRISDELREKIRELQEKGLSDSEIAKNLNLHLSTVSYQRPEVRKRKLEYQKEYYQRHEVRKRRREYMREYDIRKRYQESFNKMMVELNEFINLTQNAPSTILAGILRVLSKSKFGLKHSQIYGILKKSSEYNGKLQKRKSVLWELYKLIEMGLVSCNDISNVRRYVLTEKGKKLAEKLFEKEFNNY
jgi:IS30 family transposase